jgi:hypothetical protein
MRRKTPKKKKGSNDLTLPTAQHKENCVSGNAIKQRQRFVIVCPSYKAVMLQQRIKKITFDLILSQNVNYQLCFTFTVPCIINDNTE